MNTSMQTVVQTTASLKTAIKDGTQKFYRQGDVRFKRILSEKDLPADNKLIPTGVIVQEGEMTGHFHKLNGKGSTQAQVLIDLDHPNQKYVSVSGQEGALLQHEEHPELDIEPGVYKISIQREYDPMKKVARTMQD